MRLNCIISCQKCFNLLVSATVNNMVQTFLTKWFILRIWTVKYNGNACGLKSGIAINSLRQSDAYMWQQNKPLLWQIMVTHLFGAKPLSEPMLSYCQLNHNMVIQENAV